jgi:hypothetical protein
MFRAWSCGPLFFCIVLAGLFPGTEARAMDCAEAIQPGINPHWTYRLIDGKKCWYPGQDLIARSELHWPQASDAMAEAHDVDLPFSTETPQTTQAPAPGGPASFNNRWQALFDSAPLSNVRMLHGTSPD